MSEANGQQLPSGWAWAKLQDVADILDGDRVPVNATERAKRVGEIPYYGATGQVGWIDDFLFDETLVLLGEDGAPFFDKTRSVAYVVSGKSWVNNHAHVLRAAGGLSASLLTQQLNTVNYHGFVSGTTRWKLSQAPMRNIPLKVPPAREQERIADALDELLSDLDAGVAALERVQAKLELYRAAVLKAAMEGALTAEWRAQHPATEPASALLTRILAERRRRWEEAQLQKFKEAGKEPPKNWKAKYQEPVAPDTEGLPTLPDGWCWASVEQLGETTTGSTPSTGNSEFFGGDIPFFKPTDLDAGYNVRDCRETLTASGAAEGRVLPQLSILVTCIGATIGKVGLARTRCATNQQINALSVLEEFASPFFVFWSFCSPFGQKQIIGNASATTLPILNKRRFQTLPFAFPPLAEQEAIVEAVEDQLSVIEHLETDLEGNLKSAQALRQSILRHAFTGQLVPQDPKDEPAAELLKRISAEREERARHAQAARKTKRQPPPRRVAKQTRKKHSHD